MNPKTSELSHCLQRFFREHLTAQRNVSSATLAAYADTFRLLFRFLRKAYPGRAAPFLLDILTPDIILRFLDQLEHKRGNCVRTRNARLAAIRSFVHYLSDWLGPELPQALPRIWAFRSNGMCDGSLVFSIARRSRSFWLRPMTLGPDNEIIFFSCYFIILALASPKYWHSR